MQMSIKSIDMLCCPCCIAQWRNYLNGPLSINRIKIIDFVSNFNVFIQHGMIQSSSYRYIINPDMTENAPKRKLPIRE